MNNFLNNNNNDKLNYTSTNLNLNQKNINEIFSESSSNQRISRFNNLLINYDYKTGHYIGNWESQYPFLINSFIEVSRGIKKPN
jgi:hypothetical protein